MTARPHRSRVLGVLLVLAALAGAVAAAGCGGSDPPDAPLGTHVTPALAVDSAGVLWAGVHEPFESAVVRVTDEGRVLSRVPLPAMPVAVETSREGVWVLDAEGITRFDPVNGAVVSRASVPGGGARALARGAGVLWVVVVRDGSAATRASLLRMDPVSLRETGRIALGAGPEDVAFAAGRVWATDRGDAVVRAYHPRTLAPAGVVRVPDPPRLELDLTPVVDDRLWVESGGSLHPVVTNDGASAGWRPILRGPDVEAETVAMAPGNGHVWVLLTGPRLGDYRLVRVLSSTGQTRTVTPLSADGLPRALADDGEWIWLATHDALQAHDRPGIPTDVVE